MQENYEESFSLTTGSPAGRTPPHGDGSLYSQAYVRAGKVLRPPIRALPSVIVVTEKVMREADGPVGRAALTAHFGGKVIAPGCASKAGRVSWWGAEDHKRMQYLRSKWKMLQKYWKFPKSECPDIWIRLPRHKMAKIMVQCGRDSRSSWTRFVRSPFGWTIMGKAIWENPIEIRLGESFQLGMVFRTPCQRITLVCLCGWNQIGWTETKYESDVESTQQRSWFGRTNIIFDHVHLGCTQRQCEKDKDIVDNYRTMFESMISAGATEKWPCSGNLSISSWSCDMEGHAKKCVERYCELANRTTQQLYKVSTPCLDHWWPSLQRRINEIRGRIVKSVLTNCSEMLIIGTYWNTDILWSANKLARSITKWTKACDKRLSRLISYTHHTSEFKQYCHVGNTAKQCRLGLFQDSDFAGDLEDWKSTSGGTLCILGSHTFVPISWMCKKQTSVSHSSTESEITSLDAGLRMDGTPALDLWDLIVIVLHTSTGKLVYISNAKENSSEDWWSE